MKPGRHRKWTNLQLEEIRFLMGHTSASKVARSFNTTKNSIIGALYRDKVRNGYVPPPDSKYTGPKNV